MNCPHCNAPNADDARFCGVCGRATSATEPVSNPGLTANAMEGPNLVGREIAGRYRILAKLGEGGMGAVYRAEQISLKRQVAVKILRPEVASSQLLLRRFNAEAEAVAKLSHPNTVNIYDFGQDTDGTLFIAMEYIEGKSLREVIHHDAPLPLRRAFAIAVQVAASLTDAHGHSIIHRDLKPDNVMLQDRGRQRDVVRVLDFGIAKLRDENRQSQLAMTQAGDMLGTPQYMAPEQIRAETIDGRTDVYALGCLLYEMITARLPYEAPTVMALLSKHLLETAPRPSERRPDLLIPPHVDHLIMLAMAKDPAARPPTMEVFGEQLAQLLASFPVDTAAATAQVGVPTSPQGVAYTPTPPPGGPPPSGYGLPPSPFAAPGSPSYAAPAYPTPPPPGGYQPAPPGATPYDPYAAQHQAPPPQPVKKGGNLGLIIVVLLLLLGGAGAGVYFGVIRKTDSGAGSSAGSGVQVEQGTDAGTAEPPSIDATTATGDDIWAGKGAPPVSVDAAVKNNWDEPPDQPDEADEPDEPDEPVTPVAGAGKLPPECEAYARVIEKLATCKAIPAASRQQILQSAKQMRDAYANTQYWTPEMRTQVTSACVQGTQAMQQSLSAVGCL